VQGKQSDWRKEVRTEFADARLAAETAKAGDPGAYAMAKLKERLEDYDFPIRLAAEWGHEERLLKTFDASRTSKARKLLIIALLGEMFSAKAAPRLTTALKDPDLDIAKASAVALGNIGQRESIPALIELLHSDNRELRIAGAKGLGQVGAFHGDNSIIPPLLDALKTDDLELKTEVVWALGKLPDRRAYEPLRQLQGSLRNVRTSDRSSQEAKLWDAVSYSLKQLDAFDQLN
jgi:HEAT repeat protein